MSTEFYRCKRIKGLTELIPHMGPIPIVIPIKIFLERVGFPADNISSRVAWKFRGRIEVQKHVAGGRELRWFILLNGK